MARIILCDCCSFPLSGRPFVLKSPAGVHPHKGETLYEQKDICESCLRGICDSEGGLHLPYGWADKYRPRLGSMMTVASDEDMREVSEERLKPTGT
jgi:hypothetical protein